MIYNLSASEAQKAFYGAEDIFFKDTTALTDAWVEVKLSADVTKLGPRSHILLKTDDGNLADLLFSFDGTTTHGRLTVGRDISIDGLPADRFWVKRSAAAASSYSAWAW